MRSGLVIVGIILLVLGGVLMYVPLVPQSTVTVTYASPYAANVTGFTPTGSIPGTVTWSSSSSTEAILYVCTGAVHAFSCNGTQSTQYENGTSGSFSFSVHSGGTILIGTSGTISATVKLAEVTIGFVVLVIGAVILLLGVVLRGKKPAAAAAP
jgi:hypothetical protein